MVLMMGTDTQFQNHLNCIRLAPVRVLELQNQQFNPQTWNYWNYARPHVFCDVVCITWPIQETLDDLIDLLTSSGHLVESSCQSTFSKSRPHSVHTQCCIQFKNSELAFNCLQHFWSTVPPSSGSGTVNRMRPKWSRLSTVDHAIVTMADLSCCWTI